MTGGGDSSPPLNQRGETMQYLGDNPNMFIVRAPLRISLFGGGTDLPEFYERHGGTVVSLALDKYIYVVFNRRFTGGWRISYSATEEVGGYDQIRHMLVRAAYERYQPPPCTLTIIGDMPKETGLGSSSALAVALVRALASDVFHYGWAEAAFEMERDTGAMVGKQDHYAAVYGGFNVFRFESDGKVQARRIWPQDTQRILGKLQEWSLLLYTGRTRPAAAILVEQSKQGDEGALTTIKDIADEAARILLQENLFVEPENIGEWLNLSWVAKRYVVLGITDDILDAQYSLARFNGAIGGKLLGAGGGGCWFFVVPPDAKQRVKDALGLMEISWGWDMEGCKAVLGHGVWLRRGK